MSGRLLKERTGKFQTLSTVKEGRHIGFSSACLSDNVVVGHLLMKIRERAAFFRNVIGGELHLTGIPMLAVMPDGKQHYDHPHGNDFK